MKHMKRTVIELLRQASTKFSNTAYLNEKGDQGWISESFEDVLSKSACFAAALLDKGLQFGDRIAMLAEGRNDWVITEYGVLRAGCINVPLSIKLTSEEIQFRIEHAACKAMICSSNTIEKVLPSLNPEKTKQPLLIYMDQNLDKWHTLIHQYGLNPEKDFVLVKDLYALGAKLLETKAAQLEAIEEKIEETQTVTISYTSGTTGNPKGIMLSHLNYWSNSTDAMTYFNVNEGDRLMLILPLDHSFAHTVGIYACAVKGLSIYFADARGGSKNVLKNIPINIKEANPHFMLTVPALTGNFMNKMKEGVAAKGGIIFKLYEKGLAAGIKRYGDGYQRGPGLNPGEWLAYQLASRLIFKKFQQVFGKNFRYNVGGGALLDISQQRFFAAIGVPVFQGYGLTEATPIISANTPARHKLGTSGMVLPGIECKILNTEGKELPTGKQGEIVIKGNNVMNGYYLNPEATAQTIKDGWLFTGDIGYFDEDGFLVVVGREKALLIAPNGEKFSPEGIEEAIINSSELISQAMVYNDMKPYTIAVINLNHDRINSLIKEKAISNPEEILQSVEKSFYAYKDHPGYKGQIPDFWAPKTFIIGTEDFTEQNQMINSTMKMVRHKVFNYYEKSIGYLYTPEGSQCNNSKNLENLRRLYFEK